MSSIVLITAALLAVGFVGTRAAHYLRIPHSVFLVFLGVASGLILRANPAVSLPYAIYFDRFFPDLILYVLLPPLVFDSAYHLDFKWLKRDLIPVTALAVVALVLSTVLIGYSLNLVFGLQRMASLTFGALISATDPVAVVALFKEVGAPKRLTTLIEGESLLNDGTAIALFRTLLVATTALSIGKFSVAFGFTQFILVAVGGILFGLLVGFLVNLLLRFTSHSAASQLGITVAAAYLSFIPADRFLGVSGVIATMTVGLSLGRRARLELNKEALEGMHYVWEFLALVANTLVFFAVGLSVDPSLLLSSVRYIPLTLLIVYLARAVSIFTTIPLVNRLKLATPITFSYQVVLFWGGLRGGLALGLVLLLPTNFPHRELFVALAIAIVFSTLFVNALTTARVLKLVKLDELAPDELDIYRRTLRDVREAVLSPLARAAEQGALSVNLLERWREPPLPLSTPGEFTVAEETDADESFDMSSFWLAEKMDYEKKLSEGILSKAAYQELSLQIDSQLEEGGRPVPRSEVKDVSVRKTGETLVSRIRRKFFDTNARSMVNALATELEVLLQKKFTMEQLVPTLKTSGGRKTIRVQIERGEEQLQEFYRLYTYYSPVLQALFVADRIRAQSRRALERLAESATINRAVFAKATAELETQYRVAAADAWRLLRPTPAYLLGRHLLFKEMPKIVLRKLGESIQRKHLKAGETLLKKGEANESLWIVVAGMLETKAADPLRFFPGDSWGELSLFTKRPAPFTLSAILTTEVLELKQVSLDYVLQEFPLLRQQIFERAASGNPHNG